MTSGIKSLNGVGRAVLRVSAAMVLAALVFSPVAARAEDSVQRWNEIAARTAAGPPALGGTSPYNQARVLSIVQLAVFEAVNAITGDYEPYLNPATTAPAGANVNAAVIIAAHKTLTTYFTVPATVTALDAARDADLGAIPDGPAKTAGMGVGMAAANAMIALRAADGSAPVTTYTPSSTLSGEWQLTTGCAAGVFFNWQNVTPFGIESASDYLLPPPPALTSNEYLKAYNDVKVIGSAGATSSERPADRTEVARLYAATSPSFALAMAARQISTAKGKSLSENARDYALIQMAINDALVASFMNKYEYNFWRPETAIRNGGSDGNNKTEGDGGFTTFIPTPCFPSYPSNHASGTGAGLEAMRRLYGAAGHEITITNNVPALGTLLATTITKHYTQLKKIADDVDDARVYGGIHYWFDQSRGGDIGRAIATEVVKNNLRPVHP